MQFELVLNRDCEIDEFRSDFPRSVEESDASPVHCLVIEVGEGGVEGSHRFDGISSTEDDKRAIEVAAMFTS